MRSRVLIGVLALAGCNAKAGARCFNDGEAHCEGSTHMLLCHENEWTAIACGGPGGCKADGRFIDCDESQAVVGAPCGKDPVSHSACAGDGSQLLECHDGTWHTAATCRGPGGCNLSDDRRFSDCDDSLAIANDPCVGEKNLACSSDGREVLRCTGARWVTDEVCAGRACVVEGDLVECPSEP